MFKFASVPVIVIEEELFDPEPTVMPAVDPSVKVPFATESETESEAPDAVVSVRLITELENV